MTNVDLARVEFAFVTINHFFFVPITIGLAFLTALLQTAWHRSGRDDYLRLTRFFGTLLVINVAIGVVTGIVQEFQFGMNWGAYSRLVGNIFGAPLAMEGLAAFFLESTFLGLWLFGWDKLPRRIHLLTIWAVSLGSMLSAAFIMAANSWMQHPVGYVMVNGKPQLNDIWALFTNPVFVWGYAKVLFASLVTGAVIMLAVSAWQLRHGGDRAVFTRSARLALIVLVPAILFTMLVGDELGVIEARYQPMKIAAAEAQWTTCQPCSFSLFQIGGGNNDQTPTEIIAIPHLLSLLATNHWNGQVVGLNPLQQQYTKQFGPGYYVPNVFIQYWCDAGDGLPGGPGPGDIGVGAVADPPRETRHLPGVPVGGGVGGGAAVPDEHRGLVPDRKRPAAVDRAGHHAHQERDLPDRQHHHAVDQPDRLHPALRHARHRRPDLDAAVLPQTAPAPAHRSRRRRAGAGRPVLGVTMGLIPFWYIIIAILWTGFFILEGFDFGVGMLHSLVGGDEAGRRAAINTIGPLWDGNEVWLIVAGAGMFAAFPGWYATMFSAYNLALVLLLAALIVRGVAFEYRGKRDAARWRRTWDVLLTAGSLLAPLLIGVALAGLLHGLPINSAQNFTGSFWDLLQPYALFTGVTLVLICLLHGATFLCLKTTGDMRERSWQVARRVAPFTAAAVIGFVIWTHVTASTTFFLNVIELLAVLAVLAAVWLVWEHREGFAFAATAVTIASCILAIFVDLYPNVMVSSTNPAYNLTVHNTASGGYSLKVMTVVVVILLPVVLAYQTWTYYVFRRRVSRQEFQPPAPSPGAAPEPEPGPRPAAPSADPRS